MQTETRVVPIVQRTARILMKVILALLLLVVLVFLLLLTPPVQRFATTKIENFLENKLKTRVEIGSIAFGLPRDLHLQNVYIEDRSKDTLISGGNIDAEIEFFALLDNELRIHSIDFNNITAKVKREGKDTVFNFQFIVDAFTPKPSADTSTTIPMRLEARKISVNNSRIFYNDVVTGNEMLAIVGEFSALLDTVNPYTMHYDIEEMRAKGLNVRFYQRTPLVKPESVAADLAEAARPSQMKLNIGRVLLKDVDFEYGNDVSAFYTILDIGSLDFKGKTIDLNKKIMHFEGLAISKTNTAIRLGKKAAAKQVEKEIEKEVEVQKQQGWVFRINDFALDDNTFQFDNDNHPKQGYGMDYSHMRADDLTFHVKDFVMNTDTIGGLITKGSFKEKSGFELEALEGEVLYAHNQAHLKNLYLKTPGTELKRQAVLQYASYDELVDHFERTVFDLELVNSHVQVKDILTFAPQLRSHPAFKNPSATWYLNVVGSGTMDRLHFDDLKFDGLSNTSIDGYGTLSGLTDPNAAGGSFVIRRLHTNQTDISLFTGQRLSTPDVKIPEEFDVTGTVSGNANNLATNLNISTVDGGVSVNGRFRNLMSPTKAAYSTQVVTRGLRMNRIMPAAGIGSVSANLHITGTGFTPETFNAKVNGRIHSIGYNNYNYRNIALNGTVKQSAFNMKADIRDPNADLTGTFSGTIGATSSFKVDAMVDSLKTLPLHFTTEPLVFRGKVNADIRSLNKDYLDGEVLVTNALMISKGQRLEMDTMSLVSGREGSEQFMRLTSEIANAELRGQYKISELAAIIQHNIDPYFSVAPGGRLPAVSPYDITFTADIQNSPFLSVFMPGVNITQPLHAEGSLATGKGINAVVTTSALEYGTNKISDLNFTITTTPEGLKMDGSIGHLVSGNSYDIYHADITATALNNVIDFKLGIDDKAAKDKYNLSGIFRQSSPGVYSLKLKPEGLMLNYETWTVSPENEILISPSSIRANNFTLSSGAQQLTLQTGTGNALNANFSNFRIGTITGFIKADSILVDGTMNGNVVFTDIMKQPLFTADLVVKDFSLRQDTLGDLDVDVRNTSVNNYLTDIRLTGRGNDVSVTGNLKAQGTDVLMDLNLDVKQLQLNTLEGALASAMTNATGSVDGSVKIKGTLAQPDIVGSLHFNK
jgi:translocation and assembly module TamB